MRLASIELLGNRFANGAARGTPDMDVKMIHLLPAGLSVVDYDTKTVAKALLSGQFAHRAEQMAQQRLVAQIGIEQIDQMPLGHHEKVHWRGGVDVMEGEDVLVFINLAAWDFAANNTAKNTGMGIAGHEVSPGQTR